MANRNSSLRRKNFYLDQDKIRKVQQLLGAKTETDAIDKALDIALFRVEILKSLKQAAGKSAIAEVF